MSISPPSQTAMSATAAENTEHTLENSREPEFPLMAERPIQGRQLSPFRELYAQGVRTPHVDATFSEDVFPPEIRAWLAPGVFDYTAQEEYWRKILVGCPDANLCLRLYSGSPPWWNVLHLGELQRYADGSVEAAHQRSDRRTLPSLASKPWRAAASEALPHFLHWLEKGGWSERVWGLFPCYGTTWEWGILGTDRFPDYSEPMRARFRDWLRGNYRDVAALRDAWGDAKAAFEKAEFHENQS